MKCLWDDQHAAEFLDDPLRLRVYSSQLLGKQSDLVLHGGGNTSVKQSVTNLFGETEDVLYIKGSGWDLATIEMQGFAPVRLDVLKKMAQLEKLSDGEMVKIQRTAMTDPTAPNPSVEAILHAIIPFKFVDHTHADAVVTITNTENGEQRIRKIYGPRVLIVPYVMPGFILSKTVFELTQTIDWQQIEGMILMNHGVFTFSDTAKECYEKMIKIVSEAETYLDRHLEGSIPKAVTATFCDTKELARLRYLVSEQKGSPVLARIDNDDESLSFANQKHVSKFATRGPLTPDHVIRTKRIPMMIDSDMEEDVVDYASAYQAYFDRHTNGDLVCLDSAPRWAVWPNNGTVCFGGSVKELRIVSDITHHTMRAIQNAEKLGGWRALDEKEIFDVEYWELEQAKLRKNKSSQLFQGKIALVTGAASGIGRACVNSLLERGAAVVSVDIDSNITTLFDEEVVLKLVGDVTKESDIKKVVEATIRQFGGLDILISNAGIFPASENIADLNAETWERSLAVNLTSHQKLLKQCIPYLSLGMDPAVVMIGSKNVHAPGPGASAYSVAKAGLTQLVRVAALELGSSGIRVNVVHPNQVFDTAIWTPEILEQRAKQYGMNVNEYKTSNLLKVEITSRDVAELVCVMAGPTFAKTTGAQVSIDGGNERVI